MKAVIVMFDSLNRHMLPPYGARDVYAPNFTRLAARSTTMDKAYVGSMPCMPARRDFHTGRYNFLHRSWGPLEPFDFSFIEQLRSNGVYTHLVSDHYHYWEDGGATYHNRYSSWQASRGQEGDLWKGRVDPPSVPPHIGDFEQGPKRTRMLHDQINRQFMQWEEDFPQGRTFREGIDFIERNRNADNWLLQIETFDPHEPHYTPERYRRLYPSDYHGPLFDWPYPRRVEESTEEIAEARRNYRALVSMCDDYLGRVLDVMDAYDMWQDTMLLVLTDHGFLLSEHGWWGKNIMPFYNEISHIPMFVHDPRNPRPGERSSALTQLIDVAPTLLSFFGQETPQEVHGSDIAAAIRRGRRDAEAIIFGQFGRHVYCSDGRYIYMRGPAHDWNGPLYEYTVMPTRMVGYFSRESLRGAELTHLDPDGAVGNGSFRNGSFSKGVPLLKIDVAGPTPSDGTMDTLLFDLATDPDQTTPLDDPEVEERMIGLLVTAMKAAESPPEQFERLGLPDRSNSA